MKLNVKENSELLEYLYNNLELSKKKIKSYLTHGDIFVNNTKTTKYDYKIFTGDIIKIDTNYKNRVTLPFEIIYEDNDIIVVDKPSGLLSIATDKEHDNTLFHIVREYLKKKDHNAKVFIIHRLDKDTSGVVIMAKSEKVKNIFQEKWNSIAKVREYTAIVENVPKKDKAHLEDYLTETKTNLVYITSKEKGRLAVMNYEVEKTNNNMSLLKINIETGRKNQIRVQLANIGCPIVGDKKYKASTNPINRLCLHASKLIIYNPLTNKEMKFTSKVPTSFKKVLK